MAHPSKEIDVAFLVFVERYATDLIKWDILTFFARNPDFPIPASKTAKHLGRSVHSIRPELGDLAMLGILNQSHKQNGQTVYRLTQEPQLRKIILRLIEQTATSPIN